MDEAAFVRSSPWMGNQSRGRRGESLRALGSGLTLESGWNWLSSHRLHSAKQEFSDRRPTAPVLEYLLYLPGQWERST
jgi:hypothetical protein